MKLKPIHQLTLATFMTACVSLPSFAESKIEFSGVIETTLTHSDDNNNNGKATQAKIDKIELGMNAEINDRVSAEVVLQKKDIGADNESEVEVDSALINITAASGVLSLGKFTAPFSSGETNFIDDPATLIEPVGVGVLFSSNLDALQYSIYVADPLKDDAETINDRSYVNENALGLGGLAGMDVKMTLNDNLAFNASYATLDGKSARSIAVIASQGNFGLIAEATDADIASETRSNIELSYGFKIGTLAASTQKNATGDTIQGIAFSTEVYKNTLLSLQHLISDPKAAGSTSSSTVAMLAYEF